MKNYFFLISVFLFSGCISSEKLYTRAVRDAKEPDVKEINYHLTFVSDENSLLIHKKIQNEEYILVVSWKKNVSFYKNDPSTGYYNTGNYPLWVTIAPELKEFINDNHLQYPADTMRLKELLGLPPVNTYNYVITCWVKPADLFRPCPDAEIDDTQCSLEYPALTSCEHFEFINELQHKSYSDIFNLYNNYPWTQLGYTYDWNKRSKTHFGLSEFVIQRNSNIVVDTIYTTEEYFH